MPTPPALLTLLATLSLATPALAQFKLEPDAPTPLRSPSPLIHYTLENPYPLAILLVAIALIAFFSLNSRGQPKQARRAALAPFLTAAVLIGAAFAITTKREKVILLTKQLVADVAAGDIAGVDRALTPNVKVYTSASSTPLDKDKLLNRVKSMLGPSGAVRIEDHALLEAQVEPTSANLIYLQVKVRVTPQGFGPVISWWRLDAVPAGDSYQFSGIQYLSSSTGIDF
jgi:hypothetical protein